MVSKDRRVFGFGSLVNPETHAFATMSKAHVSGEIREWASVADWPHAFLSLTPQEGITVPGLVLSVPATLQADLDRRETHYTRHDLPAAGKDVVTYRATSQTRQTDKPILLSYLDVVIKGYLEQFTEAEAAAFFFSTRNWDHPILNDRAKPLYPRASVLNADQTAFVDRQIAAISATVI